MIKAMYYSLRGGAQQKAKDGMAVSTTSHHGNPEDKEAAHRALPAYVRESCDPCLPARSDGNLSLLLAPHLVIKFSVTV